MFKLLINSLNDLRKNLKQYIIFGLISLVTTSFIFVPLITFIFKRMIMLYNSGAVLNQDAFKIFLDKDNLLSLFSIILLAVIFVFMEMAIYVLMVQKRYFKKDISISEAFFTSLMKLPRLLTIELIYFLILFIFLLPLIELPVQTTLNQSVTFPIFYEDKVTANPIYLSMYFALLVTLLYGMYRFIFTIHGILLRKEKISLAMKNSLKLTKVGSTFTFIKLVLVNAIYIGIGFLLLLLVTTIQKQLNYTPPLAIRRYLLTLSGMFFYFYTMLLTPLNMIFLTRLYYDLGKDIGYEEEDHVKLYTFKPIKVLELKMSNTFKSKKMTTVVLLVFTLLFTGYTTLTKDIALVNQGRNVEVIAHRGGYKTQPENSLSAIENAIEKNVRILELDIQLTKDGVPVLHHDYSLYRIIGLKKRVSEVNFSSLKTYRMKGSKEEHIPSLKEALTLINKEAYILIDLKGDKNTKALIDAIIKDLKETDMMDYVYIQSFDHSLLEYTRAQAPEIKIGQVMYFFWGQLSQLDVDFYTIHYTMLTRDLVKEIKKQDKPMWVWTVDDEKILDEVLKFDIDGVITSDIDMTQEVLGLKEEPEALEGDLAEDEPDE